MLEHFRNSIDYEASTVCVYFSQPLQNALTILCVTRTKISKKDPRGALLRYLNQLHHIKCHRTRPKRSHHSSSFLQSPCDPSPPHLPERNFIFGKPKANSISTIGLDVCPCRAGKRTHSPRRKTRSPVPHHSRVNRTSIRHEPGGAPIR